jgi:hypothetical protein
MDVLCGVTDKSVNHYFAAAEGAHRRHVTALAQLVPMFAAKYHSLGQTAPCEVELYGQVPGLVGSSFTFGALAWAGGNPLITCINHVAKDTALKERQLGRPQSEGSRRA